MNTVIGRAPTQNGGKYVRQLCKHWSHKFATEQDGDRGTVRFPDVTATMDGGADVLTVTLEGEDAGQLERMKGVVADHLDRFAFREAPLPFTWE